MTPEYYPIIDVEFHELIEPLDSVWGVWSVTATLEDGSTIMGTCHGDGVTWTTESFEPDIGEE